MTIFIILAFAIPITVSVGVLSYLIYDTVIYAGEIKANPPDLVFLRTFKQVKDERIRQYQ